MTADADGDYQLTEHHFDAVIELPADCFATLISGGRSYAVFGSASSTLPTHVHGTIAGWIETQFEMPDQHTVFILSAFRLCDSCSARTGTDKLSGCDLHCHLARQFSSFSPRVPEVRTDEIEGNMRYRYGVRAISVWVLCTGQVAHHHCCSADAATDNAPNILLILVDDMGWSDLGCYGGEIDTPNLDWLAERGIRFTQFHNTSKCFPSRACLLTGLYAQQCGMGRRPGHLRNCVTLGEVLRTAGYRTLMTGKHHGLDNPFDRGFDRYFGLRDGACNYFNPGLQREGEGVPAHKTAPQFFPRTWCIDDKVYKPFTPRQKDFYTTDYFTRYALEYLDEYASEDKPFFLYIAYNAPHDPLQAWPEDIAKYRGRFMEGYAACRRARYRRQREMGLIDDSFPLSAPVHADWDTLTDQEKVDEDTRMAVYAAMIDRVDQNIGQLLNRIDEQGELDNTLVIFASDNGCAAGTAGNYSTYNSTANEGEMGSMTRWTKIGRSWSNVSNTPFRFHKTYTHKGGTCTPLIASWPAGIKGRNRISHEVGHFIDLMPTLIEASGAVYPAWFREQSVPPMQGRSLIPVFQQRKPTDCGAIYWKWRKGKAVRHQHWRLVSDQNQDWQLYDMRNDKTETTNLTDRFPDIARELGTMHSRWLESMTHPESSKDNPPR